MDGVDYLTARMRLLAFLLGAVGVLAVLTHSLFWPRKPIPVILVDGEYSNACCSDIMLKGGTAIVDGRPIPFVLDRDNVGLFALPNTGISIARTRLTIGVNQPYKLRFDNADHPTSIEVTDFATSQDYVFVRR